MLKFRILSVLGLLLPLSFGIRAEERGSDVAAAMQEVSRPVIGRYGMAIGGSSIVSTYLSPVEYTGLRLSIGGEWDKVAPFAGGRLKMHFEGNVGGAWSLLNTAATASMQEIDVDFSWTLERLWRFPHNFTFSAGAGIMAEGGAAALLKNSNNPVAVNIAAAVNARCEGTWQTHISRLPMLMRVGMRMPLAGAFFMPEYGETFYEIYLGNRRGLVHALYPGNRKKGDRVVFAQPYKGSPADRAGLKIGDKILAIDGKDARGFTTEQVSALLKGDPGTQVKVTVERLDGTQYACTLTRERIAIPSIDRKSGFPYISYALL